jgi:deazaflavin-dependent oxidoreductase (nitroreductase family)
MGRSLRTRAFDQVAQMHVAAYRLSRGRVGGTVRGAPVLLLDHVGRKSGRWRTTPLLYLADGTNYVVVGSMGGSHRHPSWFVNLRDMEETTIEVDGKSIPVTVRVASAEERSRIWPRLVEMYKDYAAYQERTDREIPLVILTPIEA